MSLRILIVRVGAMGDVLHGLPAVAALRQAIPDCVIGWAIEPRWKALLSAGRAAERGPLMPIVDRVHEVRTTAWKSAPFSLPTVTDIAQLRLELRAERYDVCVDLQGSIRSAMIGRLAGAKRFLGPDEPRERLARLLYDEPVPLRQTHVIDQACELLTAAAGLAIEPAAVTLPRDIEAEVRAEYLLRQIKSPVALLVPSAGWGAKEWGVARYRELANRLHGAGARVIVNSAAHGDASAEEIASGAGMVASTNLPQLIALARRVSVVIGGDTGPVHLAAALGRPVVALFGPTDPARNGPRFPGAQLKVLRKPESRTSHKRLQATEPGLAGITVDEVIDAVIQLIPLSEKRDG